MKLIKALLITTVCGVIILGLLADAQMRWMELYPEYQLDLNEEEGGILEKHVVFDNEGQPSDFFTNMKIGWIFGLFIFIPVFLILFGLREMDE